MGSVIKYQPPARARPDSLRFIDCCLPCLGTAVRGSLTAPGAASVLSSALMVVSG
jgi:hypothetical protein